MSQHLEIDIVPQFPVSLRTTGRYKALLQSDYATYSAKGRTPAEAAQGAIEAVRFLGGYEIALSTAPKTQHPILVDLKIIWATLKMTAALATRKESK